MEEKRADIRLHGTLLYCKPPKLAGPGLWESALCVATIHPEPGGNDIRNARRSVFYVRIRVPRHELSFLEDLASRFPVANVRSQSLKLAPCLVTGRLVPRTGGDAVVVCDGVSSFAMESQLVVSDNSVVSVCGTVQSVSAQGNDLYSVFLDTGDQQPFEVLCRNSDFSSKDFEKSSVWKFDGPAVRQYYEDSTGKFGRFVCRVFGHEASLVRKLTVRQDEGQGLGL